MEFGTYTLLTKLTKDRVQPIKPNYPNSNEIKLEPNQTQVVTSRLPLVFKISGQHYTIKATPKTINTF